MTIVVTDDELVAAAVQTGRTWDGLLPSLDLTVAGELLAATARGYRALGVRGLIVEGEFAEAALELGRFVAGDIIVRGFSAFRDTPLVPIGPGLAITVSGDEVSFDLTTAAGTHDITPMASPDEAWTALHNLLEVVYERGIGPDRVFTVLTVVEVGVAEGLIASLGTASRCEVRISADGRPQIESAPAASLDEAEKGVKAHWLARA